MEDFLNWSLTCKMYELGYDGSTLMWIDDEEDIINDDSAELIGAKPAILYSAAFRWFREKYNVCPVFSSPIEGVVKFHIPNVGGNSYSSYEEAEQTCLEKLIEIVEEQK
jgi:hypothetical protein